VAAFLVSFSYFLCYSYNVKTIVFVKLYFGQVNMVFLYNTSLQFDDLFYLEKFSTVTSPWCYTSTRLIYALTSVCVVIFNMKIGQL